MAFPFTRVIPAVEIPTEPIRCPACKGQNLTLHGYVTRGFVERVQEGETVEQAFEQHLERETSSIDCHTCEITFQVMTQDEYELMQRNMMLNEHLALTTTKFAVAPGMKHVH